MARKKIIFFDGVCNLCNTAVSFVIDRDPKGIFSFAPFQSHAWEGEKTSKNISVDADETFVLVEDRMHYTKSTAALRVIRYLRWPYPLLYGFIILPRFLRDFFYAVVAKNRYKIFGKRDTCRVPAPEEADRFLP